MKHLVYQLWWYPVSVRRTTHFGEQRFSQGKAPEDWRDACRNSPLDGQHLYAAAGQGLSINQSKHVWLQTELKALHNVNIGDSREHCAPPGVLANWNLSSPEQQSQKHSNHPRKWWDNKSSELKAQSPDFRLAYPKKALWIGSSNKSTEWAAEAPQTKISGKQARAGVLENFTSSSGTHICGNTVNLLLSQRDTFVWTASICQHVKSGQARQALAAYDRMREAGVLPNSYTFVAALKACSRLKDLERATQLHLEVVEGGLESNAYVGTMLVDVYTKCGSLANARGVFEGLEHRNSVSWNAMILGYAQMEAGEEALQLFARMQLEGFIPNERTFVCALKAYGSLALEEGNTLREKCLEEVRAIHLHIVKNGFELDTYVGTMLVDVYAKCGSLLEARFVFEKMPRRDVVSWTAMILSYVHVEDGEEALQLYARMQLEGIIPNDRTFVGVLKACCVLATLEEGCEVDGKLVKRRCLEEVRAIHSNLVNSGLASDKFVCTMLIDGYVKCGCLVDARRVFEKMHYRDVVFWTAMIVGYAQLEQGEEALQLYTQMQHDGVIPNDRTFVGALKACSSLAAFEGPSQGDGNWCVEQVRVIHADVVRSGFQSDAFVGNMLVDAYAKCGSLEDARCVFENMPHRDVVAWTAMIYGYTQMEQGEEALQLYSRMEQEGVVPDARAFVCALKACGHVAGLKKGIATHAKILANGLDPTDAFLASSLIDMYCKCGSMVNAQQVFDTLPTRNVVTWSALIAGYALQGDSECVFTLFHRMREEGVQPDSITFLSLLTSCSHAGLVEKGQTYFEAMSRDYGIAPNMDHYNCVVDLLGRAGQLDKAMAVANAVDSGVVWKTLLGACRKWCNAALGRHAFDCLVRLDQSDAAAYQLMSNIYAAAHLLEDAWEIQARSRTACARKTTGQSWWTDTDGIVHPFVVGDRKHLASPCMYAKLQDLFSKMLDK